MESGKIIIIKERERGRKGERERERERTEKKRKDWPDIRVPIHRSCLGGEHTTVPRITIQVRRTVVRARTRQITHTRSQSRKEVDSLALTLRSTISYTETGPRDCTSTHSTHRRHQNGDTNTIVQLPPANRNTWRTRPCEGHRLDGDGFLNLAIKDPSWPG